MNKCPIIGLQCAEKGWNIEKQPIPIKDQIIIAASGLRGGIAFSLTKLLSERRDPTIFRVNLQYSVLSWLSADPWPKRYSSNSFIFINMYCHNNVYFILSRIWNCFSCWLVRIDFEIVDWGHSVYDSYCITYTV